VQSLAPFIEWVQIQTGPNDTMSGKTAKSFLDSRVHGPIKSRRRGRDLAAIPPFAIRNLNRKRDMEFEFIFNNCNKEKDCKSSSIYNVFDYIAKPLASLSYHSTGKLPNSARYL
jgi:hypothetical protein